MVVLALVVPGGWLAVRALGKPSCGPLTAFTVAAAAEIAPAVRAAAEEWAAEGAESGETCVTIDVTGAEPVDIAAAVASRHGVTLTGVGQAAGTTPVPDVWLPDSSVWLSRLAATASGFTPSSASVALSPVVLAMPEPVASQFGWPESTLSWGNLVRQLGTGTQVRTGIVEPTRDVAGLSGLLALSQAAGAGGAESQQATTGALRSLAAGRSLLRPDLLARFPRSPDPASVASALGAAPLSEQAVISYNAAKPPIGLAALYVQPAPLPLDYPYAVMPGIDPAKERAATRFRDVLREGRFADRLARLGLRGPDGVGGSGFPAPTGAPAPAGTPLPAGDPGQAPGAGVDPAAVERALSTWTSITLPARMLAVVDVSGSMRE
ncbi:MAG TPA: substrate-binding domain-containing protein, partial [Pilimelia sp.]|nr:substrate-binding domain-containing protein [Pilimelia sp.]